MTKKLEELFNLPNPATPEEAESIKTIEENRETLTTVSLAIDKIDAALPGVKNLDTADDELDELAELAKSKAQDLIDLGMNIDPRFAGVILQTAGTMLGHAITAKTAKLDKKLKMVDLQLKKLRLDRQDQENGATAPSIDGQGVVLDRNELLKQILNKK
jgi:hypothetical protein